jgi:hypothetical protein
MAIRYSGMFPNKQLIHIFGAKISSMDFFRSYIGFYTHTNSIFCVNINTLEIEDEKAFANTPTNT